MTDQEMINQNWRDLQGQMKPQLGLENDTRGLVSTGMLNSVKITTEDRLRGAIRDAANMLEAGYISMAAKTLREALRL